MIKLTYIGLQGKNGLFIVWFNGDECMVRTRAPVDDEQYLQWTFPWDCSDPVVPAVSAFQVYSVINDEPDKSDLQALNQFRRTLHILHQACNT